MISKIAASALFFSLAFANLDPTACNKIGACLQLNNCNYASGYTCPGVGDISDQVSATAELDITNGNYEIISAKEFPTDCDLNQPNNGSVLVKKEHENSTYYGYIDFTCQETTLVDDCYNTNRNPSSLYICKVVKSGVDCTPQGEVTVPSAC